MGLEDDIRRIESELDDPRGGLPEPVFRFVTRLTPMVAVDLLIRENGRTLLTWRDDDHYHGWHVPGGIVRYKERMADRLKEVARLELGVEIAAGPAPMAVNEIIHDDRDVRGHFISFLFECRLTSTLQESRRHRGGPRQHGQWAWHDRTPEDIIGSHAIYRRFIDAP